MLGDVSRYDQSKLARAKAQPAKRERDSGHLFLVALPGEGVPVAVAFPAQRRLIGPFALCVGEQRANRLTRDRRVDVGALTDCVHVYLLSWVRHSRLADIHYASVGADR